MTRHPVLPTLLASYPLRSWRCVKCGEPCCHRACHCEPLRCNASTHNIFRTVPGRSSALSVYYERDIAKGSPPRESYGNDEQQNDARRTTIHADYQHLQLSTDRPDTRRPNH